MRWSASQTISQIICGEPLKLESQEWRIEMGTGLAAARRKLATAISQGQVHAFGRRTKHGALEEVPCDIFRIPDTEVVISPYGEVISLCPHRPYQGEPWYSIEFEQAEVTRLFPTPPKPPVFQWMKKEAERYRSLGQTGKQTVMVKDCQKATGCTKRTAIAAHRQLPEQLRFKVGKPPTHAG